MMQHRMLMLLLLALQLLLWQLGCVMAQDYDNDDLQPASNTPDNHGVLTAEELYAAYGINPAGLEPAPSRPDDAGELNLEEIWGK